jgi:hypothetical protein
MPDFTQDGCHAEVTTSVSGLVLHCACLTGGACEPCLDRRLAEGYSEPLIPGERRRYEGHRMKPREASVVGGNQSSEAGDRCAVFVADA